MLTWEGSAHALHAVEAFRHITDIEADYST